MEIIRSHHLAKELINIVIIKKMVFFWLPETSTTELAF